MRVYIDFSFTLLNREHFSANETFSGRQIKFTFDSPAQGNRRYIPVDDLYERNFTDSNGEFQLELTVANARTVYETELRLPMSPQSADGRQSYANSPSHQHGNQPHGGHHGNHHDRQQHGGQLPKTAKLETTYFSFGGFDWNLSLTLEPYSVTAAATAAGLTLNLANNLGLGGGESPNHRPRSPMMHVAEPIGDHVGSGTLALRLRRLTGVDHRSRSRYYISIGEGERRVTSALMDDVSDAEGAGSVWSPRMRIQDVAPKGILKLMVELVSANTISETMLTLSPNSQAGPLLGGLGGLASGTCYDRDKQAWSFEADTHSENGNAKRFTCRAHHKLCFSFVRQARSGSGWFTVTCATFRATTSGNHFTSNLISARRTKRSLQT